MRRAYTEEPGIMLVSFVLVALLVGSLVNLAASTPVAVAAGCIGAAVAQWVQLRAG